MTTTGLRAIVGVASVLVIFVGLVAPAGAEPIAQREFEDAEIWAEGLADLRSLDLSRTDLVGNGFVGRGLGVDIPVGGFRGFGPFDRVPLPEPEEAWYRYHVRLLNWDSVGVGKLPGLSGVYSKSGKGCIPSTTSSPGWSARGLFGAAGSQGAPAGQVPIGTYLYHLDQAGTCGDHLYWDDAFLRPGRWYCIEGHLKLNTPGLSDGSFEGWLDGDSRLTVGGLSLRRDIEPQIGIREMWLNVYFGGSYSTPNALSLILDQVEVSDTGRIGCQDPFIDDDASIHEPALTELHARGFLYGCGHQLACPSGKLTRAHAAAFFSRIFDLPDATSDYFHDDNGSAFEGAINRMAEARLVFGCTGGGFCPDREVTRAEFAAMTVRALDLDRDVPDAFLDDSGHWAASAIDAFAASGITKGCGEELFCPDRTLPRSEAAAFLVRIDDILRQTSPASTLGSSPQWPPSGDPPPIPLEEQD